MSAESDELLAAWEAWDDACLRVSEAGAAKMNGKKPNMHIGEFTLKREADRMSDAANAFAASVGLAPSAFRSVLAAWRQAGLDRQRALNALQLGLKAR